MVESTHHYPELNNLVSLAVADKGAIIPLLLPFEQTGGTGLCNPSIFIDEELGLLVNIRHVNYILYHSEFDKQHPGLWGCMQYLNPEDFVHLKTTNYLCQLNENFEMTDVHVADTSHFDVEPKWEFIGLEDARLVNWDGRLYQCGVRRDTTTHGQGRIEMSHIKFRHNKGLTEMSRTRFTPPQETYLEKNWMPILDMPFCFIRWCNPLEIVKCDPNTTTSETLFKGEPFELGPETELRGGSQVVTLQDHYLCITHECTMLPRPMGNGKDAHYYHRFVFFDKDWQLRKLSAPFKFMDAMVEFACGLAVKEDQLLITFGYQDNAAYLLKMPIATLDKLTYV